MLADFASYLWNFLLGIVNSILGWFKDAFSGLYDFFSSAFSGLEQFFSWLFQSLLNGIGSILQKIFQPIYDIITAIFHLISKLIDLLWLLLQLFGQIGRLIFAFVQGLFSTLSGLSYDGSTPSVDNNVSSTFSAIASVMQQLQLDNIAYLLLFAIWIFTAYTVVKMIGSFGGGSTD